MTNKNSSPIVQANTQTLKMIHPGYRRRGSAEHADLLLIVVVCFLAYGLLLYFCMPTVSASQYSRVANELSYHWQATFDAIEYRFYTAYLPYFQSLLREAMALIGR